MQNVECRKYLDGKEGVESEPVVEDGEEDNGDDENENDGDGKVRELAWVTRPVHKNPFSRLSGK